MIPCHNCNPCRDDNLANCESPTKVWVYACCHNEAEMMPWFLRHYLTVADRIIISDDNSTDGCVEMTKRYPSVTVEHWPFNNKLNEEDRLQWAYSSKVDATGKCHWMLVVDIDELVIGLNNSVLQCDADVIVPTGFNMVGDGLCQASNYGDGVQLYDIMPMGVYAPVYSKPIMLRPEADVKWTRGRHQLEGCNPIVTQDPRLKLLHYRYLGADYTRIKNVKNWERVRDKGVAWSCDPSRDGWDKEGSPAWAEYAKTKAFNVIGRS